MSVVMQRLLEAEGMDDHFPRPSAHGSGDLAAQKRRRRATQKHLDLFSIEQPPEKAPPAGPHLQLVEAPGDDLPSAQRGKAAIVLLNEQVQVLCLQFC